MRLKKEHTGYWSHGQWQKYQSPQVNERPGKVKKKKDDTLCIGKAEHKWHRYQRMAWSDEKWDYIDKYERIECFVCGKHKSAKTAKSLNLPLHVWVEDDKGGYDVVQVKVNGEYQPIPRYAFHKDKYWCDICRYWH